jgi:hypothetical protein
MCDVWTLIQLKRVFTLSNTALQCVSDLSLGSESGCAVLGKALAKVMYTSVQSALREDGHNAQKLEDKKFIYTSAHLQSTQSNIERPGLSSSSQRPQSVWKRIS